MSLDNGIIISHIHRKICEETFPSKLFVFFRDDREGDNDFSRFYTYTLHTGDEICYWRKCYNIRDAILKVLKTDEEKYEYPISYENLLKIIKVLKSFNKRNWNDNIWEWREVKNGMRICIHNLKIIAKHMRKYPGLIQLTFYDSY